MQIIKYKKKPSILLCALYSLLLSSSQKKKKASWDLESRQGFAGGPNKIERMMIIEAWCPANTASKLLEESDDHTYPKQCCGPLPSITTPPLEHASTWPKYIYIYITYFKIPILYNYSFLIKKDFFQRDSIKKYLSDVLYLG